MKLTIVAADFNKEVVGSMIELAEEEASRLGGEVVEVIRVPGCYEIPFATERAFERNPINAVVALGYIEKGETLHGEVMGHVIHTKMIDLQFKTQKPIGLGIIGPGATLEQAKVRVQHSAINAVDSVFALHALR